MELEERARTNAVVLVAAVVTFLASEEASYVTAQIISVSGGMA